MDWVKICTVLVAIIFVFAFFKDGVKNWKDGVAIFLISSALAIPFGRVWGWW